MRTEKIELFPFNELSEGAKEKAREKWREFGVDYEWWDSVYDCFMDVCSILGFDVDYKNIYFSGFCSQGDGASFTGSYSYSKGSLEKIRKHAPMDKELHDIAKKLQELQRKNFYQLSSTIDRSSSNYCHENTIYCGRVDRDAHNYQSETSDSEDTLTECARILCQWLYTKLESEHDYLMSDEYIDESMNDPLYEFNIDGSLY